MKSFWSKFSYHAIKDFLMRHKIISFILLIIIIFVVYKLYVYYTDTSAETHYLISAVEKGTILQTVSGTGQVSASSQIDLKPKVSGDVVYVGARSGDYVTAGQLLVKLDSRDAEIALETAKLNLDKAKGLELSQVTKTTTGLSKNYSDSLTVINKYFINSAEILDGLEDILANYTVSTYKMNLPNETSKKYYDTAFSSYYKAKGAYEKVLANYRSASGNFTDNQVSVLLAETIASSQLLFQAVKDTGTYVSYVYNNTDERDRSSDLSSDKANLETWIQTVNSDISSLTSSRNTITISAYDIRSLETVLKQKEYALEDCSLRAPLNGVVQINVKKGDYVSGSVGTFVTRQKIATVSLNEVDIAKVKVGQKATLTFDAIDELNLTGQIIETDIVGTVSQGVVTYNVKIGFDTQDERVRSGMSVSADITTNIKQDIIVVPSASVKTQGGTSYVEVVDNKTEVTSGTQGVVLSIAPISQEVTIGLSDDTSTEILSGLKVGDKIITRTITNSASKTTTASAPSLLGAGGRAGGR